MLTLRIALILVLCFSSADANLDDGINANSDKENDIDAGAHTNTDHPDDSDNNNYYQANYDAHSIAQTDSLTRPVASILCGTDNPSNACTSTNNHADVAINKDTNSGADSNPFSFLPM